MNVIVHAKVGNKYSNVKKKENLTNNKNSFAVQQELGSRKTRIQIFHKSRVRQMEPGYKAAVNGSDSSQ